MKTTLLYDGTFDGFLTAVYQVFEEKIDQAEIVRPKYYQPEMFSTCKEISTNTKKSKRVWNSLVMKTSKAGAYELYKTFLSEIKGVEALLLRYIIYVYSTESFNHTDYSNNDVLRVSQVARMVHREKQRLEALVRFQLTKDGFYFASVEPDFNVVPLIAKHFKQKYADQRWLIYDFKRNYGIYYNLESVERIRIEEDLNTLKLTGHHSISNKKEEEKDLRINYFQDTPVNSGKKIKLHKRHIPKRYWKYITEKQQEFKKPSNKIS